MADPYNGKTELHNTWLVSKLQSCAVYPLTLNRKTDIPKSYIDWAIKNGFEVIDVNIPRVVAIDDVS